MDTLALDLLLSSGGEIGDPLIHDLAGVLDLRTWTSPHTDPVPWGSGEVPGGAGIELLVVLLLVFLACLYVLMTAEPLSLFGHEPS